MARAEARVIPCTDGHPAGAATLGTRPEDLAEHLGPVRPALVTWHHLRLHLLLPKHTRVARGDRLRPRFDPQRVLIWGR